MITVSSSLRIPISLKDHIMECVTNYLRLAEIQFNRSFDYPRVMIRKKGSVAGTAHLQASTIVLNGQLLLDYHKPFIEEVIPHELAHLLVHSLYGKVKPHGKEWQWVMESVFRRPAKRTHTFINHHLRPLQFRYKCLCQIHYLTSIRHNRIQHKKAEYSCRHCKQKLYFAGDGHDNFIVSLS